MRTGASGEAGSGTPAASAAWTTAEHVARASYGRLLAILAAATKDIELAEDALSTAFARALESWPSTGVPANPEAWLLTVARNTQRDVLKSPSYRTFATGGRDLDALESAFEQVDPDEIPDRRLALLFVCAHPAIEPGIRTPLMLQAVLGIDAQRVAEAFATPTATMAQRLVRAKRRIRSTGIPFAVPGARQLAGRRDAVLEAVYGAYAIDWLVAGTTPRDSLAAEAHYLAVTLAELLPEDPEALGLAALVTLSISRAPARGHAGEFIPLDEQDTALWDLSLIRTGEEYLRRAHRPGRIGRFQLEAAIQSVHCARATSGTTDWEALRKLYAGLVSFAPTLGARVALAAAVGKVSGPEAGLGSLNEIADPAVARFQPAWATRAHLLASAGRNDLARDAFDKAISLTTESGLREYLRGRGAALGDQ